VSQLSPFVSLITINFNQPQITCEFLRSLKQLTYKNYEVIVIDNASAEDPTTIITHEFPSVRFYRTKKNLGFAGGNNVGIKLAKGDFFFIVNNDTVVTDTNLIEKLIEPFYRDSSIGMVSPKIRYFYHPNVIQFAGYNKINSFTGRNSQVGDREDDKGQYNTSGYTHYANGAAMMVKKEVVEKVGVFTNHFFLMYEELDWSAQTVKRGYKIYYQAEVYLLHKESMSVGKTSPLKVYYNNRNRIMFMRRNTTAFELTCFLVYLILLTVPKNVFVFLVKRQFEHLKAFINAMVWNVKNISIYKRIPFYTTLDQVSLDTLQKA
jgi:GT2 family glycosyltransferase